MKRKTLVLMCGPAGSGKSSWVAKEQERNQDKVKSYHVSRDLCRFELVNENEEYFSKEDEVFRMFINKINEKLADKSTEVIYVDATHINEKARNKVLDKLNFVYPTDIKAVAFHISLETCLARNAQRSGRALVPEDVIKKMYENYTVPTYDKKHKYKSIIIVKEDGNEYEW